MDMSLQDIDYVQMTRSANHLKARQFYYYSFTTTYWDEFNATVIDPAVDTLTTINSEPNTTENSVMLENNLCRMYILVLYAGVCVVLCAAGLLGNVVSYVILGRDKAVPVATALLRALAVADIAFLSLWIIHYPVQAVKVHLNISISSTNGTSWIDYCLLWMRVISFPILYTAQTQTIWITVAIALNRFVAVCRPYSVSSLCTLKKVRQQIGLVSIFSVVYNIPRYFELIVVRTSTGAKWKRTYLANNYLYKIIYTDIMYYMSSFIVPLTILAVLNLKVVIAYRETIKRRRTMTSRWRNNINANAVNQPLTCTSNTTGCVSPTPPNNDSDDITTVMVVVVVIFMICQAPARLLQIASGYRYTRCEGFIYYLTHGTNALEVLNSSVNFIVYFLFRKRFRDILRESFSLKCGSVGTKIERTHKQRKNVCSTSTSIMALEALSTVSTTSPRPLNHYLNNVTANMSIIRELTLSSESEIFDVEEEDETIFTPIVTISKQNLQTV